MALAAQSRNDSGPARQAGRPVLAMLCALTWLVGAASLGHAQSGPLEDLAGQGVVIGQPGQAHRADHGGVGDDRLRPGLRRLAFVEKARQPAGLPYLSSLTS